MIPIENVMICLCGHSFVMHPIDRQHPFAWPCIEPLCHCEEWQEIRPKAKKLAVDIWNGM